MRDEALGSLEDVVGDNQGGTITPTSRLRFPLILSSLALLLLLPFARADAQGTQRVFFNDIGGNGWSSMDDDGGNISAFPMQSTVNVADQPEQPVLVLAVDRRVGLCGQLRNAASHPYAVICGGQNNTTSMNHQILCQ